MKSSDVRNKINKLNPGFVSGKIVFGSNVAFKGNDMKKELAPVPAKPVKTILRKAKDKTK